MLKYRCMLLLLVGFGQIEGQRHWKAANRSDMADFKLNYTFIESVIALENTSSEHRDTLGTKGNLRLLIPVVLGSNYQLDLSQANRYLAQNATYFICGSRGLCNGSVVKRIPMRSVNCHPCQCDKSCHFYGDCCPDKLFEESPDMSSVSNQYLICSLDSWTTWNDSTNIFMIGKCPPNSNPNVKQKCEFPDKAIQTEATPVSILESSLTYRNRFCAECHAVVKYQIWRHEVSCSLEYSVQAITSKADLWRYVIVQGSGCVIVTNPPGMVSIRECYPVGHNTCNTPGKDKEAPDAVVERLCHMYSQPVYLCGINTFFSSYRNIFCSMCDGNILRSLECTKKDVKPKVPYPINVLLDFNPRPTQSGISVQDTICELGQALDPFSRSCQNISCPLRRILIGNECEDIYSRASGLGITMAVVLQPTNKSLSMTVERFKMQYMVMLNKKLELFEPFVVHSGVIQNFAIDIDNLESGLTDLITVNLKLVSQTTQSLQELETVLFDIMKSNFTYLTEDDNIILISYPVLCPEKYKVPSHYFGFEGLDQSFSTPLTFFDKECDRLRCSDNLIFESVQMNCPFLEYNLDQNITFSFSPNNHTIIFASDVLFLKPFKYLVCGEILGICTDELDIISRRLSPQTLSHPQDLILSLVSLVCMCLSLVGLFFTFITYSLISKLRTLPGKNTMSLVFNLFLAQLLFLTASNRTWNIVVCQVMGVLIHYFWLSSFSWMFVSAYHMFLVFTNVLTKTVNSNHHFLRYALICNISPAVVVGSCLTVFLVPSGGNNSGYGGTFCFINHPMAILGFFAVPLGLVLLLNIFFFVRTIQAIRSVPDMTTSSNQNNQQHAFVYLRLSLLCGFSWIFAFLAVIIKSDVLNYVSVILTASQGLMIFVGYCLNDRTWFLLKSKFSPENPEGSSAFSTAGKSVDITTESSFVNN